MTAGKTKTVASKICPPKPLCRYFHPAGAVIWGVVMSLLLGGAAGCAVGNDEAYWRGTLPARYALDVQTASVQITDITHDSGIHGETELRVGDVLLAVDKTDVTNLSKPQLDALLFGPVGSLVKLTVKRGGETKEIVVERRPD